MTAAHAQDSRRGIMLMISGVILFGIMDTAVKLLTQDYDVIQVVWARFLFHFLIFLAFYSRAGLGRIVATRRPGLQVMRSVLLMSATLFFFTALSYLPLADAVSIGFVSPLLVTALSIPFLGEKVGARRWAAIAVGFVGMLIIIRPGMGVMHWAAVLPLGMAMCFSGYQILTRIAGRSEDARTSQIWSPALGALAMSAIVPFFWTTPDVWGWSLMLLTGLAGGLGHFLLIKAYEIAPASTLSPFVYTQLIWMVIFGYLLFGDFPDAFTITGGAIVVGSGIYIFRREARLGGKA
jgi:drug/metabolite transporter (DMT)-like permease